MFAIPVQVVDDLKLKAGDYTLLDIRLCNVIRKTELVNKLY